MSKVVREASTSLFPLPVVLVSCAAPGFRPNLITLAWAGVAASDPPMLSVGIRPDRHSHSIITSSGEFVVNIPSQDMLRAVDYCGMVSGRDIDKFVAAGLTVGPGATVQTPHVVEAPVSLECRLRQVIPLGSHDLFVGEVTSVLVDERHAGARIDLSLLSPVAYGAGHYWALGHKLGSYGFARSFR